jgi:hypothetical protein
MIEGMEPNVKGPRPYLFNWWVWGTGFIGASVALYQLLNR